MKITALRIQNFRTLEDVSLQFPSSYTAICGPNDSGKTNVVRAVRTLMKEEAPFQVYSYGEEEVSFDEDYPKWKDSDASDKKIQFQLDLEVLEDRDAGFYQFLAKQLRLTEPERSLSLRIDVEYGPDRPEPEITVGCGGSSYSGIDAQEVLKRLQTSRSILFHNSTQTDPRFPFRSHFGGVIRAESPEHEKLVSTMKKSVNRGLNKISKTHQQEIEGLLGRLESKYRVGLSMPAFDFSSVPFNITLGQSKVEVPLDDWGSGTKNRTLILMTLFRAKQLSDSEASAGKITPVIIVEEPESFLHPSAQAEFGRVLNDLAEEFEVQVIVTTHSPYLLSINEPNSNVLLNRRVRYKQLRETEKTDTSGDGWMEPFSLALGLSSGEFQPWKELLLASSDAILLVEGDGDVEYFEMLRDPAHGANQLVFDGDIVSYDGTGSLSNTVLLRFIKNRHRRLFVTFDLDAEATVVKTLNALDLEKRKHYLPVGTNDAGKRCIEGLLPDEIFDAVYGENSALVRAATQGNRSEQKSAKNKLKGLFRERFKEVAEPGEEHFGGFYPLVRAINKALA